MALRSREVSLLYRPKWTAAASWYPCDIIDGPFKGASGMADHRRPGVGRVHVFAWSGTDVPTHGLTVPEHWVAPADECLTRQDD